MTDFCTYCGRAIVEDTDGALVDIDKRASGCSDSFDQGGDGEHEIDTALAAELAIEAEQEARHEGYAPGLTGLRLDNPKGAR